MCSQKYVVALFPSKAACYICTQCFRKNHGRGLRKVFWGRHWMIASFIALANNWGGEGEGRWKEGEEAGKVGMRQKETCKLVLGVFFIVLASKQIKKGSREWVRLQKLRTNASDSGLPGVVLDLPAPFTGFEALLPSPRRGPSQCCILREWPGWSH